MYVQLECASTHLHVGEARLNLRGAADGGVPVAAHHRQFTLRVVQRLLQRHPLTTHNYVISSKHRLHANALAHSL